MKKTISLLLILIILSGCSPIANVIRNDNQNYRPTDPNNVKIYMDEKSAPKEYKEIGLIVSYSHSHMTYLVFFVLFSIIKPGDQNKSEEFRTLVDKAAQIGADGVIIKDMEHNGKGLCITAIAIKNIKS